MGVGSSSSAVLAASASSAAAAACCQQMCLLVCALLEGPTTSICTFTPGGRHSQGKAQW